MLPWVKDIQVCPNEGPILNPREDNKIHRRNLKIFFSRITEPISTKLSTKHPCLKGIQVCSNDGFCLFSRGDKNAIAKIHWRCGSWA